MVATRAEFRVFGLGVIDIVKARDGLLDLKVKTGDAPEGYEIFQPRGKFPFPLAREELALLGLSGFANVNYLRAADDYSP